MQPGKANHAAADSTGRRMKHADNTKTDSNMMTGNETALHAIKRLLERHVDSYVKHA